MSKATTESRTPAVKPRMSRSFRRYLRANNPPAFVEKKVVRAAIVGSIACLYHTKLKSAACVRRAGKRHGKRQNPQRQNQGKQHREAAHNRRDAVNGCRA